MAAKIERIEYNGGLILAFDPTQKEIRIKKDLAISTVPISDEIIRHLGLDDEAWLSMHFNLGDDGRWHQKLPMMPSPAKARKQALFTYRPPRVRKHFRPRDLKVGDIIDFEFGEWVRDESLSGKIIQGKITKFDLPWLELDGKFRIHLLEAQQLTRRMRKRGRPARRHLKGQANSKG